MNSDLTLPIWLRRMTRRTSAPPRAIELLAGQRIELTLAPRDGLRVLAGDVVLIRPPQWLGETLYRPATYRLAEGSQWQSAVRETIMVEAIRASRVVQQAG